MHESIKFVMSYLNINIAESAEIWYGGEIGDLGKGGAGGNRTHPILLIRNTIDSAYWNTPGAFELYSVI